MSKLFWFKPRRVSEKPEIYVTIGNGVGKLFVRMKLWQLAGMADEIFLKLQKANFARCRLTLMFANRNNLEKFITTTSDNNRGEGEKILCKNYASHGLAFCGLKNLRQFLWELCEKNETT